MGGHDPYSSSKGAAEIVTSAYRRSFFSDPDGPRLASGRAGNVIGGGDWGEDRLVPDVMRAVLAGEAVRVRNPNAIRPWQHVINPLSGYLVLAAGALGGPGGGRRLELRPRRRGGPAGRRPGRAPRRALAGAGPLDRRRRPAPARGPLPEARLLEGPRRASAGAPWPPSTPALAATADWYREFESGADMRQVTLDQLAQLTDAG